MFARRALFSLILLTCFFPQTSFAKKLALVIGNQDYHEVPKLQKAEGDARSIAKSFEALGFHTDLHIDLNRRKMNFALSDFASKIEAGDEVVFFYAGHGIEILGSNYLLPTDIPQATPGQERLVKLEAFSADEILTTLQERGSRVSIMILDACRDNPFPKKGTRSLGSSRGLTRIEPPNGAFVIYSAGMRQTALDRLSATDSNPNSVFTRTLIPLLAKPGMSIVDIAKKLREEVENIALSVRHEQHPAYYDQIKGDYYFVGGPERKTPSPTNKSASEIAALKKQLKELKKKVSQLPKDPPKAKNGRGWLGVIVQTADENVAKTLGLKSPGGAIVTKVTKDGPADTGGLLEGDVLLKVNEQDVKDSRDLAKKIATYPPNTQIVISVFRANRTLSINIVLGAKSDS